MLKPNSLTYDAISKSMFSNKFIGRKYDFPYPPVAAWTAEEIVCVDYTSLERLLIL
jgi:hypothetical protein